MKSRIKLILAFVLSMLMVFAFAGCANMANGDNGENGGGLDDTLLIYDFEQWKPDFSGTHISDTFGRVSLNTDATYIAHGKGSAKIEPEGGGWMYIQTASDTFGYDNSDFTHVSGVQVKFYNATEESMPVVMGFVTKVTLYDAFDRLGDTTFTLAPGWNTVTLELPAEIMCYMADVSSVEGISFSFPNGVDSQNNQTVFYLDDVRLVLMLEENSAAPEDFPYDFAGYAEQGKLVAFEDDYSDQFFIHEKESEMAVVNSLVEKNGLGEIIGLPEENKPEDDYVFKVTIDTEAGWTESGGLNSKLLCDTLKQVDPELLNDPRARIAFRLYSTSPNPASVVNRMICNVRFRPASSYTNFYTNGGNYMYMNQWYDYEIPLSTVLASANFSSDAKVGTDLINALDNITFYTCSYLNSSTAIVPYTFYMSDFYIKVPNYETEKGKLVNFQSDGSVDFVQRVFATELSLVDAAAETNFHGEPIGIPYADNDDRKGDTQVLKVEVPAITGDWEDTITIPVDMLKLGFDKYEAGEIDKNAKITLKMYITGDIQRAYGDLRAWYNVTGGQVSTIQKAFPTDQWYELEIPLSKIMDDANFKSTDITAMLGTLKRFTFRGPVQTTDGGNTNVLRARTMYISDIYITPAE